MAEKEWIADEVRALRLRLSYTQATMADVLGYLNAGSVGDLERGVRHTTGPVRRLLDFLDHSGGGALTDADPAEWLPAQIRALRLRLGLSQAAMAVALGYGHEMSVSSLERGVNRPVGAVRRLLGLLDAGLLLPASLTRG